MLMRWFACCGFLAFTIKALAFSSPSFELVHHEQVGNQAEYRFIKLFVSQLDRAAVRGQVSGVAPLLESSGATKPENGWRRGTQSILVSGEAREQTSSGVYTEIHEQRDKLATKPENGWRRGTQSILVSGEAREQTSSGVYTEIHEQRDKLATKPESERRRVYYLNSVLLRHNHYTTELVDQGGFLSFFSSKQIYKTTLEQHGFLGINGGYFTPENKPLGLLVINGKKIGSLSHSWLMSGFVEVDATGAVHLKRVQGRSVLSNNVIQTGPFLLLNGKANIKTSGKLDRRTVLAITDKNDLLVVITSEMTLFDLAQLLQDQPKEFGVNKIIEAINLDGGTSTAMSLFLPGEPTLVIPEILPVRTGIVFKLK